MWMIKAIFYWFKWEVDSRYSERYNDDIWIARLLCLCVPAPTIIFPN